MYGEDYGYAASRLDGTIVTFEKEPVFVHAVKMDGGVIISNLSNIYEDYQVELKQLNLIPVKLGMCNFDGMASYLSRIPLRRDWKQGLRKENFTSDGVANGSIPPDELAKVIKGEYPTFKECLSKILKKGCQSIAWNRNWALTIDNRVKHKTYTVGTFSDKGEITLNADKTYLYESLREVV